jgi:hypothetical protein
MMKNLEVLEEIRKQGKNLIETKRDEFVKQNLLSDEFIEMMQKNKKPFDLLMSYYQCAIMEIETKFRVLNQEYSLSYDQNPIEGIKTRVKSYESIMRKIRVKDIPVTLESIEENIRDYEYEVTVNFGLEALEYDDIVLINAPFTREVHDEKFLKDFSKKLADHGAKLVVIWVVTKPEICHQRMIDRIRRGGK